MKGLLIKDTYILVKQMKIFMLALLIMAVIPNSFTNGFALMYSSLLPVTAMSYDEHAKWNVYATMMPYRAKDLVLSKYLVGLMFTLVVFLAEILSILVRTTYQGGSVQTCFDALLMTVIIADAAVILMSLNLPMMFKLGVEKGRFAYIIVAVLFALLVVGSIDAELPIWQIKDIFLVAGGTIVAFFAMLLSLSVSVKIRSKASI